MKGTTVETAVEMEAKPRTKEEKIADAFEVARKFDSLSKAVSRLECRLKDVTDAKLSVHRSTNNTKLDFSEEEASSYLATGIRSRITELNREIDAIVEGLP